MTRHRWRATPAVLAIACALAGTTASFDAQAQAAPDTPLSKVNGVLGAIANAYGTFQALEFLGTFFGIGAGPSMNDAITQLENFMQSYRDGQLASNVHGDLLLLQTISSDYMNGLTDGLEVQFITNSERDFASLQDALNSGNMTDAYLLGPGFNLLGLTFVAAMKAFGIENNNNNYPQWLLDSYLSQMVTTDYPLVGGITVDMDVSCSVVGPMSSGVGVHDLFQWTQGGKKMWPKYGKAFVSNIGVLDLSGIHGCSAPVCNYMCDLTQPCNSLSSALTCCQSCDRTFDACTDDGTYCFCTGGIVSTNVTLPADYVPNAMNLLSAEREAFLADPSVTAVRTGMLTASNAIDPSLSVIGDNVPTASCQGHVDF